MDSPKWMFKQARRTTARVLRDLTDISHTALGAQDEDFRARYSRKINGPDTQSLRCEHSEAF
jgi:hypothetical protein